MSASVKNYELTFILGETATTEIAAAKAAELTKSIAEMGGEVTKEEHWGRRDLAYPIKRSRSGQYVTMWLSLPADQLKNLDRQLRFDESIIRSLVTVAYTSAQPGSLYPVVEEEAPKKGRRETREEPATAEEQLRRSSGTKAKKEEAADDGEQLTEADRLAQLDTRLDNLLKGEESN